MTFELNKFKKFLIIIYGFIIKMTFIHHKLKKIIKNIKTQMNLCKFWRYRLKIMIKVSILLNF